MLFQHIGGLESTKRILLQALQNQQIAHAQLFCGQEGSANLALAWAYITYLNCPNPQVEDACGHCISCMQMKKLIHPDVHFVYPVAVTKKVETKPLSRDFINEWRSFLLESPYQTFSQWLAFIEADNKQGNISVEESRNILQILALKPLMAQYKTILIWLPEYMNLAAANALLKILEEPPSKTLFLLVTQEDKKLLPTIISRTQRITIPTFSDEEVVNFLVKNKQIDLKKARQIAYLCEGNLNEALKLLQENTHNFFDIFRQWMLACYGEKVQQKRQMRFDKIVAENEKIAKLSKDEQKNLLLYSLRIYREVLLYQYGDKSLLRLQAEELNFVSKFAQFFNMAGIETIYEKLNEALYHLERNANPKITFLDLSIHIAQTML
ncbi:MAG: DNA polymerase III subunit delta [Microscillaceae bacterium]|nr:DNA polymerase III subunit delta [Microscillaceae bacterium]MDW8461789.1 DNA polymerase III subunit delta [Cytophagales bacterium]